MRVGGSLVQGPKDPYQAHRKEKDHDRIGGGIQQTGKIFEGIKQTVNGKDNQNTQK